MLIESYPARDVAAIYGDNWKDKAQRNSCIEYAIGCFEVQK